MQSAAWALSDVIGCVCMGGWEWVAQVTIVKLSHMGCEDLALRGASELL